MISAEIGHEQLRFCARQAGALCRDGAPWQEYEDLQQEAVVGLLEARDRWQGRAPFLGFAAYHVYGRMWRYLEAFGARMPARRKRKAGLSPGGYVELDRVELWARYPLDTPEAWAIAYETVRRRVRRENRHQTRRDRRWRLPERWSEPVRAPD